MNGKRNNQVTGNIGMYYSAFRLSQMGYNVIPTARNAKGIDLIVYNDDASRMLGVQVKCLSSRYAVPLGIHGTPEHLTDKLMGDIWCIVVQNKDRDPSVYVLTLDEVRSKITSASGKMGESYWLEYKEYAKDEYRDAWGKVADKLGSAM